MGVRRPEHGHRAARGRIATKSEPYECGLPSEVKCGFRFGISFYLIAMLFILFDIEVDLPLPDRGPSCARSAPSRSCEAITFVVLLFVAFVYVWRRGALEWR